MDEDRGGTLRKIRALIDKANATTFEAERDTFLAAADRLMTKYSVEEFELAMARPAAEREKPEVRDFQISDEGDFDFRNLCRKIFHAVVSANRAIIADYGWGTIKVIGYKRDLDHIDLVFTSVLLFVTNEVVPKPDPAQDLGTNLYKLKLAGYRWQTIHTMMASKGVVPDEPWERRHGVKYTSVYKKHCEKHGLPQLTKEAAPGAWRESFMAGFMSRIKERFQKQAKEDEQGYGIVLHGMQDAIKEALYELYPDRRPHPKDCECDSCHYVKCHDQKCTRPRCVEARKPVRYKAPKERYANMVAWNAGRSSADRADLGSTKVGGGKQGEL